MKCKSCDKTEGLRLSVGERVHPADTTTHVIVVKGQRRAIHAYCDDCLKRNQDNLATLRFFKGSN